MTYGWFFFCQKTNLLKYLVAASLRISRKIVRKQTDNQSFLVIMFLASDGLSKKWIHAKIIIFADLCMQALLSGKSSLNPGWVGIPLEWMNVPEWPCYMLARSAIHQHPPTVFAEQSTIQQGSGDWRGPTAVEEFRLVASFNANLVF